MSSASPTCGTCRSRKADPKDRMTALGFVNCAYLPAWRYRAPHAACEFDPSRFEEAA